MKRGRHGSGTRVDVLLMCGAVGAPSIATVLAAPSEPVENAYVESFHPVPRGSPAYQGGEEQGAAPGGSDHEATAEAVVRGSQPVPERMPERALLPGPAGSPGPHRGLASGVQGLQAA